MITLALFTTTKGHYDHKEIYKTTISSLLKKTSVFTDKIVHIKREKDDELVYHEMVKFFVDLNFDIIETFGEWKHNDVSHFVEHAKDIVTLMRHKTVQKNKYVFWLEDDFIFESGDPLDKIFKYIIQILDENPNKLNVRFLRDGIDIPTLYPTLSYDNNKYFAHKDVFSFNPTVLRSRDAWILSIHFIRAFNPQIHIERFATESLRPLSADIDPFLSLHTEFAKCIHIGTEDFNKNDYE